MKLLKTILIIIFIILALLLILKDPIISFYYKFLNQLPVIESIVNSSIKEIEKEINTPEPLRARDDSKSAYLTIAGVIKFTNMQRFNYGLPALKENLLLDKSADIKLKDMFNKQYFEHVSPSGVGIDNLAKNVGYKYLSIGENLALGNFTNDDVLVKAWMDSPGHKANILNKRYTEIGIAVGKSSYEGRTTWMAVQHFGMPASACKLPDETLKIQTDSLKKQIDNLQATLEVKRVDIENSKENYGEEYNRKVEEYNRLVEQYNSMVKDLKNKVSLYNSQVDSFNRCSAGK